jgi:SAM-dependent methyltransferase
MLPRKVINLHHENRLKNEGNILNALKKIDKNKNLNFLLKRRYSYIEKNIKGCDIVLELGCGAGHSKKYIKQNIKISDLTNYEFIDYKNVDCLNTPFEDGSYDAVFSLNLIHHIPNPIKLFNEVGRILKKGGKYVIIDTNLSYFFKLITILTKSEKYDLNVNIYDEKINLTNPNDTFDSNNAVPKLIFDNFQKFNNKLKYNFEIDDFKNQEFFNFINSGGVIIDSPYIPLNNFLLKSFDKLDNFLSKFNNIFPLLIYCCLQKK